MKVIIYMSQVVDAATGACLQECHSHEQAEAFATDCGWHIIGWVY